MSKSPRESGASGSISRTLLQHLLPRVFALFLLTSGSLATAAIDGDIIRSDAPEVHEVVEGDTLWDIADTFLVEPWRWPDLWRVNPEIRNPHLIYPGDRIRLRWVDGQPRLELSRGDAGRTVKLTPERTEKLEPRVRSKPLLDAIPAIDLEAIDPFLSANRIVSEDTLEGAGYVLQGDSGRILVGAGDRLFARGVEAGIGDVLAVVRRGDAYVDPDSGDQLGLEAEEIATARVLERDDEVSTLLVTRSRSEIRIGDRLLPIEQRSMATTFFPSAPDDEVRGRILSVLDGVTQVGQFSVVAIGLGEQDAIEVGHVARHRPAGAAGPRPDRQRDPAHAIQARRPADGVPYFRSPLLRYRPGIGNAAGRRGRGHQPLIFLRVAGIPRVRTSGRPPGRVLTPWSDSGH
ncbi:MAG: LysM domain-containing protein [Gammaproteobacteria bacterium]|nr:LysM domain-containing protein [Gammaproteobacteria bacterium]